MKLPVAAKWKELGTQLQLPKHKLDEFQANNCGHPDLVQRCLSDMFHWWLNNTPLANYKQAFTSVMKQMATFENLAEALHSVGLHDAEKLICPFYGKMLSV